MKQVVPDYYKEFHCIGGACKHNCCIGWEIDIDEQTMEFYKTVSGELGERLKKCIVPSEDAPYFLLDQAERCPFLNDENLCDILLELGEECLCEICTEHPRFHNEFEKRIESGLGLCCEEAGRLILGKKTAVKLEGDAAEENEEDLFAVRKELFSILQNRGKPIRERIEKMLRVCGAPIPTDEMSVWAEALLGLERLEEAWTEYLTMLQTEWQSANVDGFDRYMAGRETEYEQFLVYLIYRHFANAEDAQDACARVSFAALGYQVLHGIGAVIWTKTGAFSFDQQVELARLFSAEIEYSEENQSAILQILSENEE